MFDGILNKIGVQAQSGFLRVFLERTLTPFLSFPFTVTEEIVITLRVLVDELFQKYEDLLRPMLLVLVESHFITWQEKR